MNSRIYAFQMVRARRKRTSSEINILDQLKIQNAIEIYNLFIN